MLATMNQIVNLLSGFQKQFPPTNNQLRTSTNPIQATIQAGHITTESVQRRAPDKALLMEAKEKGVILDAETEAFLADVECTTPYAEPLSITTTMAFKGLLSSSGVVPVMILTFSFRVQIMIITSSIICIFSVPTDVSSVVPGGISVITILDDLRSQLAGYIKTNEEQSFANDALKAELERYKTQVQNLEQELSEKLKADNNALEESYLEELVWLRNTNKVVTELTASSYGNRSAVIPERHNSTGSGLYAMPLTSISSPQEKETNGKPITPLPRIN
ncbi:hypothetical protein Tco_0179839 [Tanacetum coccineum]